MKKTILITGCSRGIGLETVKLLLAEGHKIYACVRSIKSCDELFRLKSDYNQLYIKQMDLRNENEICDVVKEIEKSEDIIDVVINNASYILFGPVELASSSQMEDQFRVNLFGPFNL
ncbi:MAG: SDR family NAD(P)-dependent oxidoreductase, partial [Bacteroidia bacterium]